jgi:hypothetical protein
VRRSDAWLYRIGAGVATFVVALYGCRYAGHYLHESDADRLVQRERSDDEIKEDALKLAHGYADTRAYKEMSIHLKADEWSAAYVTPHPLEERSRMIAGIAALVVAAASGEAALLWARKREAQRRLSGRG